MYKTTIKIDGMMCGMCESHINIAIRNKITVKKIPSSLTIIPFQINNNHIRKTGAEYLQQSHKKKL